MRGDEGRPAHLGRPFLSRSDRSRNRKGTARWREGRAGLYLAHQRSVPDHPLSHPRPDAAVAGYRAAGHAADGKGDRPFRRHDHFARRQRVPDPDRGSPAGDRLVRRPFHHRTYAGRADGRDDGACRGAPRALGRQRADCAGRKGRDFHQEHRRHHRAHQGAGPGNAGAIPRQGQACLRQAAERVIPDLVEKPMRESEKPVMPAATKTAAPPVSVEARSVRLPAKADDPASIAPVVERCDLSRRGSELLIEVKAAAVNPSDVKAATGLMPYAVFPRTPGRDYAGVVVDGPAEWIGREVFGSSGDLGIRRDGSHATHLAVEAEAVVDKPRTVSWEAAAGIGVPFVTAMEGLRRAGIPKPDETVLVMGVNGKVGQAAAQIASWNGARVIGVAGRSEPYEAHANSKIEMSDASASDVAAGVRELTS